ncbi:GNAT family N-acetyltransferase [Clostridium sp. FP2]|uniref:GNAT family N-acetyltransferase n=1 Tax=Clostridium sp. FP2 TaxID=2724481 RepID=UPI0013E99210|nr:GNAT family N-acetyltransferase [Clostridium sp. FP2]MBZ9625843.1 GNAT family N-acetyltransferase [Clostridium sp. FP2]
MLRKVTGEDFQKLFTWVNDEEVRKNSRYTEEKNLEEYKDWFFKALKDKNLFMFIQVVDEKDVGQVKLEISQQEITFNYSIAKEHRGNGFGTATIRDAQRFINENKDFFTANSKLVAYIREGNIPSCRVFEKLGYIKVFQCEDYVKFQKSAV